MRSRILTASGLAAAFAWSALAFASDVVVLRGGMKIELKSPWVRRGNSALLTRPDGTLLSVPLSEIDRQATAAAKTTPAALAAPASAATPATPAEAARASRDRPKARLKVTDSDVGHQYAAPDSEKPLKGEEAPAGRARLTMLDYTQEKAGGELVVRGSLRNAGGTTALNSRLTVSALNEKGETVASAEAGIADGTIEPDKSVSFSAALPIGDRSFSSFRFSPRWVAAEPPAPPAPPSPGAAPAAQPAPGAPANGAGQPSGQPATPNGQGLLYAAPAPSASFAPPADGKSGYIPGAASPDNQPKPPQ